MEDTRTDPPSTFAPLAPDIREDEYRWKVYVCLPEAELTPEREAEIETAFAPYYSKDWCELEFDTTYQDKPGYIYTTGTYSDDRYDWHADYDPSWLSDFAEDIGVEVRS